MKKLTLILDNTNWLEATWVEEIETESTTIWCESYSGHKEHISMLRNKALEIGTSLDEYEDLIAECESKFVYPTDEELQAEELKHKIAEANAYLASTDWVKSYLLESKLGLIVIPEDSNKLNIAAKREEYLSFLQGL